MLASLFLVSCNANNSEKGDKELSLSTNVARNSESEWEFSAFGLNVDTEDSELVLIDPNYQVISSNHANCSEYNLIYVANIDGKVSVKSEGKNVYEGRVEADKPLNIPVKLKSGENLYDITMTPYENYIPSKNKKLSSFDQLLLLIK